MANNGDCTELFVEVLRYCEDESMSRPMCDRLVSAVTGGSYATLDDLEAVDDFVSLANDRDAARAIVRGVASALYGKAVA